MPEPRIQCSNADCNKQFEQRALVCPYCSTPGVRKLYKYRGFCERTKELLTSKTLWVPTADRLNDPFEFGFQLQSNEVNGTRIDSGSLANAREEMKKYGVLCLSERNDNILMWSHYAASHQGLCLEFERNSENSLGNWDTCYPVIYDEKLPSFMPLELEDKKSVAKVLTTKAAAWRYEAEWRLLTMEGNKKVAFPGRLTGVVFGVNSTDKNRKEVTDILGSSVAYSEAVLSDSKYGIEIRTIKN